MGMENLRTTIVLEKELYRQAKRLALEQDKTLKEIIEQALRVYLRGIIRDHERPERDASESMLERSVPV
jgi:hypothetical protein